MAFKTFVFEGCLRVIVLVLDVDADSKKILGSTTFLTHSQKHVH